ncbi:helix-turn-helix domain-containing protein [Chromobacterium sp. IIBBL 290-4]|uniref:helix-turn-helix domain-containing protein n=1 Tax=Chromobacterium sp. IIBBL 290-4 TaxID=2953890 RepID=UPI0020B8F69E|nr:helix-turn-helix domain-containing protein [Chromobacterium sp. IIBBL 290-4]UTH72238.1 helix-turn-helix domain-containing protein [Chromobacterium sp. IIBBL 290-4]
MENKNARPAAAETSANHTADINDTSTTLQCARLLEALKTGTVTTFRARTELNILHPGGRIMDLRHAGNLIRTRLITIFDEHGRRHSRIAEYSLIALARKEAA